ncbi:MAG: DHA2 family efflux MFS transporter permease subunit, partial [Aquificota bacterium]|nr:DHA2 family efflux MFS transporter permease subunit [Aquificota bacterium]
MGQSVSLSRTEVVVHTLIVMVGAFMAILDTTVVDISLPKMMAPLKTDLYGIQWVVTSYMISAAVVLPFLEWFEKVIGLRNMYILGIVLFTSSSYLCGLSTELYQMIVFRSVQGIAEALVIVSAQAILFSVYPPDQKGLAMGIFGLGASFAPAIGPSLGGWITEHMGWNWIFFINVPVGILLTIGSLFFLRDLPRGKPGPFNFVSFILIGTATVGTLVVLSKGQQYGWFTSNFIAFLTVISLACYALYLFWELRSGVRLVDLGVFKHLNFLSAFLVYLVVLGFSMYALFYALPLYFEHLKDLSTFTTGVLLLPFAVSIALSTVVAGVMSDRWSAGGTLVLAIALYMGSLLFYVRHFDLYTPKWDASVTLAVTGVGMGLFFAPVTVIALRGLEEKTVLIISLLDYIRFVGGSFGTAIATNIIEGRTSHHLEGISSFQGLNYWEVRAKVESLASEFLGQAYDTVEALIRVYYTFGTLQGKVALSQAFQDLFFWCAVLGVAGFIPLILLRYN